MQEKAELSDAIDSLILSLGNITKKALMASILWQDARPYLPEATKTLQTVTLQSLIVRVLEVWTTFNASNTRKPGFR